MLLQNVLVNQTLATLMHSILVKRGVVHGFKDLEENSTGPFVEKSYEFSGGDTEILF
jgi:hypothetical protein